jgi:hypothetical protein
MLAYITARGRFLLSNEKCRIIFAVRAITAGANIRRYFFENVEIPAVRNAVYKKTAGPKNNE